MAITDSQKIDYLWKKVGFAATKTDISSVKDATNEAIPSPLQIRGDKIMASSASIPGAIPGSNTSIVTVYTTSLPAETTNDATASTNRTWKTGVTDWISPEFGSTYQAKVYISPSGQAGNVASKGTQVFATGSGNSDEWFFDYQSGVLNFIGNNLPSVSFTGNSVYVSGARYTGSFGLPSVPSLGNITFSNTTISTSFANANIYLSPTGTGTVQVTGNLALGIPSGTTAQRPINPLVGFTRFNTDNTVIEIWNGSTWSVPGAATITSDVITPDGVANTFILSSNSSTTGVMVSINGTMQQPFTAYTVSNNAIIFTEIPLSNDIIEVRHISIGAVVSVQELQVGTTTVLLDTANVNVTGNLLPTANVTYSLGSPTLQWKDLYVSSNTIYMGGTAVTISNGQLAVGGNIVAPPPYGNANVQAYTQTMGYTNYSNVNVKAYTETMTFTNYSNVNVQAYTETMSFKNYSNVNVSAYLNTQGYNLYSNVNVAAYISSYTGAITGANLNVLGNILSTGAIFNSININGTVTTSGIATFTNTTNNSGTNPTTGALQVSGGAGIAGNLYIGGNLFVAGNTTIINTTIAAQQTGNLTVGIPLNFSAPFANITFSGIQNNYLQMQAQNQSSGAAASTDYVATANNGNDTQFFIDMGINGSGYSQSSPFNASYARDGYLYAQGNGTGIGGGNLMLATMHVNNKIYMAVGGQDVSNIVATINSDNLFVNGFLNVSCNILGQTFSGTSTTARYADLAENYVADFDYVPGTVIEFGGQFEVTQCNTDMSSAVAGIVSENPAYLMNSGQQGTHIVAVALQGRVPCKVIGPIRKGNMIVSAGNGLARAEKRPEVGTVIGKSLEDFDGGQGTIEIVVGAR